MAINHHEMGRGQRSLTEAQRSAIEGIALEKSNDDLATGTRIATLNLPDWLISKVFNGHSPVEYGSTILGTANKRAGEKETSIGSLFGYVGGLAEGAWKGLPTIFGETNEELLENNLASGQLSHQALYEGFKEAGITQPNQITNENLRAAFLNGQQIHQANLAPPPNSSPMYPGEGRDNGIYIGSNAPDRDPGMSIGNNTPDRDPGMSIGGIMQGTNPGLPKPSRGIYDPGMIVTGPDGKQYNLTRFSGATQVQGSHAVGTGLINNGAAQNLVQQYDRQADGTWVERGGPGGVERPVAQFERDANGNIIRPQGGIQELASRNDGVRTAMAQFKGEAAQYYNPEPEAKPMELSARQNGQMAKRDPVERA